MMDELIQIDEPCILKKIQIIKATKPQVVRWCTYPTNRQNVIFKFNFCFWERSVSMCWVYLLIPEICFWLVPLLREQM